MKDPPTWRSFPAAPATNILSEETNPAAWTAASSPAHARKGSPGARVRRCQSAALGPPPHTNQSPDRDTAPTHLEKRKNGKLTCVFKISNILDPVFTHFPRAGLSRDLWEFGVSFLRLEEAFLPLPASKKTFFQTSN